MALTRKFRDTVAARAQHDRDFRAALLQEAMQAMFDGDAEEARSLMRDCINATVGFDALSLATNVPVKSLMRMVGPSGNPRLGNFVIILQALQAETNLKAHVAVDTLEFATASLEVVAAMSTG